MTDISNTNEVHQDYNRYVWVIPNWLSLQANRNLMESQKIEFTVGNGKYFLTRWEVGLKIIGEFVRVYWKLIHAKGFGENLQVNLKREWCNFDGTIRTNDEETLTVILGQTIDDKCNAYFFGPNSGSNNLVNASGALTIIITTTVYRGKLVDPVEQIRMELEKHCKLTRMQLSKNFAILLEDDTNSDLKIITMDGKELAAHKIILKAQCEVFASMFRNEFAEAITGIIRVDDISEKTMKLLLRYWYTGELLPSLFDTDTIIEFTYAAGKYQMKEVLQIINEIFENCYNENVTNVDAQLLVLAEKLSLEKMEAKLLKRIAAYIGTTKDSLEIFSLFGWNIDFLDENEISIQDILCLVEDLIDNPEMARSASKIHILLLRQVQKLSLRKLEAKMLACVSIIANKASSASELVGFMSPMNIIGF